MSKAAFTILFICAALFTAALEAQTAKPKPAVQVTQAEGAKPAPGASGAGAGGGAGAGAATGAAAGGMSVGVLAGIAAAIAAVAAGASNSSGPGGTNAPQGTTGTR